MPGRNSWHFYKLCLTLIPADRCRGTLWWARGSLRWLCSCFLRSFFSLRARRAPGEESGLPVPTTPLQWALTSLGPGYLKIVYSSAVRGRSLLWGCPQICSPGTWALPTRRAQPVCAQWSSPRLQWTPTATEKSSLTLTSTFRSWFSMSCFSWIYFLRDFSLVQNSPLWHKLFEGSRWRVWERLQRHVPFLFPFLLSPVTTIFRKPPVNWVSYDCSATIVFPFKFLFKLLGHLGKRRKRQQENQILYIMNLWCFSILNYSFCWQYLVILYGLRGRKETLPIWWAAPNLPSSPFFFFLSSKCLLAIE